MYVHTDHRVQYMTSIQSGVELASADVFAKGYAPPIRTPLAVGSHYSASLRTAYPALWERAIQSRYSRKQSTWLGQGPCNSGPRIIFGNARMAEVCVTW